MITDEWTKRGGRDVSSSFNRHIQETLIWMDENQMFEWRFRTNKKKTTRKLQRKTKSRLILFFLFLSFGYWRTWLYSSTSSSWCCCCWIFSFFSPLVTKINLIRTWGNFLVIRKKWKEESCLSTLLQNKPRVLCWFSSCYLQTLDPSAAGFWPEAPQLHSTSGSDSRRGWGSEL